MTRQPEIQTNDIDLAAVYMVATGRKPTMCKEPGDTEAITPIEKKFVDLKQVPNMLHILMASNNDWVVPAGMDERRYCVLKVSDAQAGNHKYFADLIHETDNGGLGAMLYDLQNWDISDFNVRDFPKTAGLLEQKLQTMEPMQVWWYQKLQDGVIVSGYPWKSVPSEQAHGNYCETTNKISSQLRKASETTFGINLRKLVPEGWPKNKLQKPAYGFLHKRVNHYELPPLKVCRKHFESLNERYELSICKSGDKTVGFISKVKDTELELWKTDAIKLSFNSEDKKGVYFMGDKTPNPANFSINKFGYLEVSIFGQDTKFSFAKR
ncbi:MAG: primase-helicase family protein [Desulfuromonadaceae bacterium]